MYKFHQCDYKNSMIKKIELKEEYQMFIFFIFLRETYFTLRKQVRSAGVSDTDTFQYFTNVMNEIKD